MINNTPRNESRVSKSTAICPTTNRRARSRRSSAALCSILRVTPNLVIVVLLVVHLLCVSCTSASSQRTPNDRTPRENDSDKSKKSDNGSNHSGDNAPSDGQSGPSGNGEDDEPSQQILTNLNDPPGLRNAYGDLNVKPSHIVYQRMFDPDKIGRFTRPDRMRRWLDEQVPNRLDDSIVCLDWEGGTIEHLRRGPSDARFDYVVREMARLVDFIHMLRPNLRVGYYHLPKLGYNTIEEEHLDAWRAAADLWNTVDIVFPSVYDTHDDRPQRDHDRHGQEVRLALELARGKPVYVYMRPRYHGGSRGDYAHSLIPDDEFIAHIRAMMRVEHNGKRPAGVVIWGDDAGLYERAFERNRAGQYRRQGRQWNLARQALLHDMRPGESREEFYIRMNLRVYRLLETAIQQADELSDQMSGNQSDDSRRRR